jgi:plastocyanin
VDTRRQPAFDGRQTYYSSGFISPSGPSGNTYRVKLSDDIEPGTYRYYCVIHFPYMQGRITVRPKGADLPSEEKVNAAALAEVEKLARPLRSAFLAAKRGKAVAYGGQRVNLPIAGYHSADEFTTQVLEFVPRTYTTRVGQPVTWTISGAHTISFGVPRYVPIYTVGRDGTLRRNPVVDRAAGGSPQPPPVSFESGPVSIDGGTWDGSGFFSSGLIASEPFSKYTLRVSKPGRYRYACLVHPKMVGTLTVHR